MSDLGKAMFVSILFEVRQLLPQLQAVSQLLTEDLKDQTPSDLFDWVSDWKPQISIWASAERHAREAAREGMPLNWEQLITEVGESLKTASTAYKAGNQVIEPSSHDQKECMTLALRALNHLAEIHRFISDKAYLQHPK